MPPALTVPTAVLELLHVPPPVASANVVVVPRHMLLAASGVIAAGLAFTVITLVIKHPVLIV
jgi:hypothetical protein